mmetsp:Transcript_41393/g.163032  ORF Transcript_41393/g.163032 Transcript_41393/m.163032 type:complete len:137 (-) Transcript_41393:1141-1551(-)
MLQDSTMKSVAETCTERVKKFEHDGVIRLNLSAPPVCSIIRQRAMEIHVRKMVKPNSDEDPVTLRTGAKYSLGHAIETAIGVGIWRRVSRENEKVSLKKGQFYASLLHRPAMINTATSSAMYIFATKSPCQRWKSS